jgi:hypothetical protein
VKGIQVCSNKGLALLQRGDNHKNVNMGWGYLKILFSRTPGQILTRLGTNHPWRKRIQQFLKEGDSPSHRGGNSERVEIHSKFLKIFSRTSWPKSIKLATNYPLVKRIQVCSNTNVNGQAFFKGGIIT